MLTKHEDIEHGLVHEDIEQGLVSFYKPLLTKLQEENYEATYKIISSIPMIITYEKNEELLTCFLNKRKPNIIKENSGRE